MDNGRKPPAFPILHLHACSAANVPLKSYPGFATYVSDENEMQTMTAKSVGFANLRVRQT